MWKQIVFDCAVNIFFVKAVAVRHF